ncbi:hydrogenase nickel incorporation protein HypB [Anaeromicropila herbilytica]|uniref:Hydrogenase accessory protein HypB n=1 Tax=Anaeromicropila herbilytica TaxID=2785025 RepID=A0A7R7EN87_9FIRM|nr:hydrogenase nickel incorporation protein HypB [Anaeromicropila herbilytica]BCN31637.1 hydrogenase accessory protein HypB [Anaeromicropila herbilytica]
MDSVRVIEIKKSIFEDNDLEARKLRNKLKNRKTFLINLMSSPGSGKTTTLKAVCRKLKDEMKIGIMEADIDSTVDAEAMAKEGVRSIQLHTGGMCHLDAGMTEQGLVEIKDEELDFVVLENVGNLVCPAEFDTGAAKNVSILSVPEGDDKPLKYPLMYQVADLLIINKIDTASFFDFDFEACEKAAKMRNPDIKIIKISAKTGEGIDELCDWIRNEVKAWNA